MRKPNSLRAAIVARLPELARTPEDLVMFVDKGRVRAPMTAQRGFAWGYDLNVIATNYTLDPAILFFAVTEWLRVEQPALLSPDPAAGFTFDVDILDASTFDIHIVLTLDEIVTATPDGQGFRLEAVPEPDPLFTEEDDVLGGPLTAAATPDGPIWP